MRLRFLLCALGAVFSLSASAVIPASEQTVAVEFYHAQFDHYFISANAKEINDLDTGVHKGWTRTGYRFSVMKAGSSYAGTSPVCRFYSATLDTHFYSAKKSECDAVKEQFGNVWTFESDEVFRAFVVDPATGVCGADTTGTYRLYNNRPDANHRYTDQLGVFLFMKSKNYIPEGDGSPAFPIAFCTPSGGDIVPVPNESAPNCSVTATSNTPALGASLNLNADCTNSPTSYLWIGCDSTSSSCTSTKTAAGAVSYTLYATNASGPGLPVTLTVNWGGGGAGGGAVPICALTANTFSPTVGQNVTLTATCNNTPSSYEWMLCSATIGNPGDPSAPPPCNVNPTCATTSPTCVVSQSQAGAARYAVDARNTVGPGPKVYVDMAWTGSGGGPPSGGGVPVCNISSSSQSPSLGSTITLTASCSGNAVTYDWIGEGLIGTCTSSPTCQATHNIAQAVTYGVSGINSAGQVGGRSYTGVAWTQTTPQPPACTLSASNMTPQVGQTITITSSCTNSPLNWTWTGCTSTTSSCQDAATVAGPKTYTLMATNAVGNSPAAPITVNWQPIPTAVPVCTVTSSSSNPYTGQNITLTAACTNSPTSYAWTNCSSTTSTCSTSSASAGLVTYGVTASNQVGPSTPPATVDVTWQVNPGSNCASYSDVKYVDIAWGSPVRYKTQDVGGFPQDRVIVYSITIPAGVGPFPVSGNTAFAEWQAPPTRKNMTLSATACDFSAAMDYSSGASPYIAWNVGAPPHNLQAGRTYYFNLKNEPGACVGGNCDVSTTIQWPH